MTILNQYVLLNQRYWGEINLSQWIGKDNLIIECVH